MESQRQISHEQARRFQEENDLKYYTEASAKSGDNVLKLFSDASKFLYQRFGLMDGTSDAGTSNNSFAADGRYGSHLSALSNNG